MNLYLLLRRLLAPVLNLLPARLMWRVIFYIYYFVEISLLFMDLLILLLGHAAIGIMFFTAILNLATMYAETFAWPPDVQGLQSNVKLCYDNTSLPNTTRDCFSLNTREALDFVAWGDSFYPVRTNVTSTQISAPSELVEIIIQGKNTSVSFSYASKSNLWRFALDSPEPASKAQAPAEKVDDHSKDVEHDTDTPSNHKLNICKYSGNDLVKKSEELENAMCTSRDMPFNISNHGINISGLERRMNTPRNVVATSTDHPGANTTTRTSTSALSPQAHEDRKYIEEIHAFDEILRKTGELGYLLDLAEAHQSNLGNQSVDDIEREACHVLRKGEELGSLVEAFTLRYGNETLPVPVSIPAYVTTLPKITKVNDTMTPEARTTEFVDAQVTPPTTAHVAKSTETSVVVTKTYTNGSENENEAHGYVYTILDYLYEILDFLVLSPAYLIMFLGRVIMYPIRLVMYPLYCIMYLHRFIRYLGYSMIMYSILLATHLIYLIRCAVFYGVYVFLLFLLGFFVYCVVCAHRDGWREIDITFLHVHVKKVQREGGVESVQEDGGDESVQEDGGDESIQEDGGDESVQEDGGDESVQEDGGDESVQEDGGAELDQGEGGDERAQAEGEVERVQEGGEGGFRLDVATTARLNW